MLRAQSTTTTAGNGKVTVKSRHLSLDQFKYTGTGAKTGGIKAMPVSKKK